MSYIEDWLEACDAESWYEEENMRIADGIWTQKDGTEIYVGDMEVSHILNCIRMLQRQIKEYGADDIREAWLDTFWMALKERGIAV